jgi:tol-pal system protein YbgF
MSTMPRRLTSVFCLLALPAGLAYAQAPVSSTAQPAGTIEQRVERMERMLQSQGLLGIVQQLQTLEQEINLLRGEIETHNYNLEQLTRRQRDLYADMDQRLQRLEGGTTAPSDGTAQILDTTGMDSPPLETLAAVQGAGDPPANAMGSDSPLQVEIITTSSLQQPPAGSPGTMPQTQNTRPGPVSPQSDLSQIPAQTASATPASPPRPVNSDPVQLQAEYQAAFNLLRQSLYDQAIKAFQQFLLDHPNDRYSDNAQYWLAEAFYVKREFQPALDEYNKVVTNFPNSQKVGEAMLKIGFTLIELGQLDNAREHLQALIRQQPDSTVARLADERLRQLGSATQQAVPEQAN